VAKDRARPFSRKHRKYWIPVTGGMILIGVINVALGYCTYDPPDPAREGIKIQIPSSGSGSGSGSAAGSGSGSAALPPATDPPRNK
jgi:hypothetical protein